MVRQQGERFAMNSPIQGTAADIIKLAMITIWRELREGGYNRMILQVHDELLFEVPPSEFECERYCAKGAGGSAAAFRAAACRYPPREKLGRGALK